jgi:hypothetical protein
MVDGSFRESFHSIDFFGKQDIPPEHYELLWVEYYDAVKPELAERIAEYPNFRIITLDRDGIYHSSYCFNGGIAAARGQVVVLPDADVVVEDSFLRRVWEDHQANDKLVMYIYRYDEPEKEHLPEVQMDHLRRVCVLRNPANYGGCLTVRKRWLLSINGYEQHPIFSSGFHANGRDVYTRLKNLGLHVKWHPDLRLYHPWHPGTLKLTASYRVQQAVIDYRARHPESIPFRGIDPERDHEPSPVLAERIEAIRKRYSDGNALNRLVSLVRRVLAGLARRARRLTAP